MELKHEMSAKVCEPGVIQFCQVGTAMVACYVGVQILPCALDSIVIGTVFQALGHRADGQMIGEF